MQRPGTSQGPVAKIYKILLFLFCISRPAAASSDGPALIITKAVDNEKDWRESVTIDSRKQLVHKLVKSVQPTYDPAGIQSNLTINLVAYAEKVEMEFYEMAKTQPEYHHLLAEKIDVITKELEEKRLKRREKNLQNSKNKSKSLKSTICVGWHFKK